MFYNESNFVHSIIKVILECNDIVLNIYNQDFEKIDKEDGSPLTAADIACNKHICKYLESMQPFFKDKIGEDILVISEENKNLDYNERSKYKWCWLIDPIDGTKEFIKKNGEFTINIGLAMNNKPVFGIVSIPASNEIYYGSVSNGSYYGKLTTNEVCNDYSKYFTKIEKDDISKNIFKTKINIVASRSHLSKETEDFIAQFPHYDLVSVGSSIKILYIAHQKADIYPRIAPTSEWDTCASHAILLGSGGNMYIYDKSLKILDYSTKGTHVSYNKENLLNPYFICM